MVRRFVQAPALCKLGAIKVNLLTGHENKRVTSERRGLYQSFCQHAAAKFSRTGSLRSSGSRFWLIIADLQQPVLFPYEQTNPYDCSRLWEEGVRALSPCALTPSDTDAQGRACRSNSVGWTAQLRGHELLSVSWQPWSMFWTNEKTARLRLSGPKSERPEIGCSLAAHSATPG